MPIFKRQVKVQSSSSDFSSFFSVITYNPSVELQLMYFLIWTKWSHENANFDTFKCFWWKLAKFMSFFKPEVSFPQILHDSSVLWNITLLYSLGQKLYTLHKRDQSKCKFFILFSARIKIYQTLVIFKTKNKIFFKFCTTLWHHETYFLHTFF